MTVAKKQAIPLFLFIFIGLFFAFSSYLHQWYITFFKVKNIIFANRFFDFVSLAAGLMIMNLIVAYFVKPKWTGLVFLVWSMLKIMLVMGYFAVFVMPQNIQLSAPVIYEIVSVYVTFLVAEVIFTYFLIWESDKIINRKA